MSNNNSSRKQGKDELTTAVQAALDAALDDVSDTDEDEEYEEEMGSDVTDDETSVDVVTKSQVEVAVTGHKDDGEDNSGVSEEASAIFVNNTLLFPAHKIVKDATNATNIGSDDVYSDDEPLAPILMDEKLPVVAKVNVEDEIPISPDSMGGESSPSTTTSQSSAALSPSTTAISEIGVKMSPVSPAVPCPNNNSDSATSHTHHRSSSSASSGISVTSSKRSIPRKDTDKLFMEMMEDMLLNVQEEVSDADEMMQRMMNKFQQELHEMEEEDNDEEDSIIIGDDDDVNVHVEGASAEIVTADGLPLIIGSDEHPTQVSSSSIIKENHAPISIDSIVHAACHSLESAELKAISSANLSVELDTITPIRCEEHIALDDRQGCSTNDTSHHAHAEPIATNEERKNHRKSKKVGQKSNSKSKQSASSNSPLADVERDLDSTISQLLDGMVANQAISTGDNFDVDCDMDGNESDLFNILMKGLQGVDLNGTGGSTVPEDFNADAVIDGMMEQLLSKDLMYEPMKEVAIRFPKWLEERRNVLSAHELQQREQQCACFKKIVNLYENQPNNKAQLMCLIQEVQEFGQPPMEIIHEIAPGFDLDSIGLPTLDGSAMSSLGENEECLII